MSGNAPGPSEELVGIASPTVAYEIDGKERDLTDVDNKDGKDNLNSPSESVAENLDKGLDDNVVIRSGADASKYLLSLRDDGDPIITFRSALLGTAFACFQAAMNQIYNVSP